MANMYPNQLRNSRHINVREHLLFGDARHVFAMRDLGGHANLGFVSMVFNALLLK